MLKPNTLGHPCFPCLKHMYPSLFKNKAIDSFQQETCILAKQTHFLIQVKHTNHHDRSH